MFKPSITRGQRERLTEAFRGEGFSVIGQLSFRLWRRGRGGFEWFSEGESEGEGVLQQSQGQGVVLPLSVPTVTLHTSIAVRQHWFVKTLTMVYFHMVTQILSEMFLIQESDELVPRGWSFSKMRAEGGLRGRMISKKNSTNWKDNQRIEWNKLLFLVPE